MKILVTNDDSIYAPGIKVLTQILQKMGEVVVFAPATQQTAKGHSMTFSGEIKVEKKDFLEGVEAYAVYGTPRDCVNVATDAFVKDVGLVVSGINEGSNISNCCVASGTIGAATAAFNLGIPAVAVSLDFGRKMDYEAGAPYISEIISWFVQQPFNRDFILSINIPNREDGVIKGVTVGDYGGKQLFDSNYEIVRHENDTFYVALNPGGIFYEMDEEQRNKDHDIYALSDGYVVLTPLDDDVVKKDSLSELRKYSFQE